MAKLPMLKPRLATTPTRLSVITTRENRLTGRGLQARRLRIWSASPHCAACGTLTAFPHGFELDHIVPLMQGGQDTDANCQVLCVDRRQDGTKIGCHAEKTARDAKAW